MQTKPRALLRESGMIGVEYLLFELLAQLRADRVGNIAEAAVRHAARGHGKEQPVLPGDDFDVVHSQHAVKGDGDQRPELAVRRHTAEFDVGDLHCATPFSIREWILVCLTIFILTKLYYNIPCLVRINRKLRDVFVACAAKCTKWEALGKWPCLSSPILKTKNVSI